MFGRGVRLLTEFRSPVFGCVGRPDEALRLMEREVRYSQALVKRARARPGSRGHRERGRRCFGVLRPWFPYLRDCRRDGAKEVTRPAPSCQGPKVSCAWASFLPRVASSLSKYESPA